MNDAINRGSQLLQQAARNMQPLMDREKQLARLIVTANLTRSPLATSRDKG